VKSQVLTDLQQMELRETLSPAITGRTDVLLRVEWVGVCGSDIHYYETGRIGSQVVQYPYRVGHECAATVVDYGTDVKGLRKGEPVVVEPAMPCGQCDQCRAGREHTCRDLRFLGCPGQAEGCLGEYLVMPAHCCFPTHGQITLEQGVLCEPFAIGVYAVQCSALRQKQSAAVFGAGPIGLSCLAAAQAQNAGSIYVTDKISERIAAARNAGAAWVGNPDDQDVTSEILRRQPDGVDVAFECAGQQETLDQAVQVLKPGGRLMMIGIPRQDRITFNPDLVRRKEISLINVRRQNQCTRKAMDLIAQGRVKLDYMITHTFDFAHSKEAFDLVAGYRDGVIKALIKVSS
jgi:L-iditol 2-dehydrogenase